MTDLQTAKALLKEIAVRHKAAFDASDMAAMGRAEEEAIAVADAYGYPMFKASLMLAAFWPPPPPPEPEIELVARAVQQRIDQPGRCSYDDIAHAAIAALRKAGMMK